MIMLSFQNPRSIARIIEYRILRPWFWDHVSARRFLHLSDGKFLEMFSSKGSIDEFVDRFHERTRLRFFFHPRNQKDFFLNLLAQTQPFEEIIAAAQDVLENKFETLGSGKVSLGETIDWQRDFKSGKVWPLKNSRSLDILDLGNPSDVKVPWELSRFHQVWWLGKAYWLTRNEEYAQKFLHLVNDWIDKNPVGKGVNWRTAMEIAIRTANWIAGYYLFCESKSIPSGFWLKFLKSLYVQGDFIQHHLEYSWRNSNHFLSNVTGMIFLGIFFRDTSFGKVWLSWGVKALAEEMEQEVYPDGVDYEKSTSYQRLVLELFYVPTILCLRNNIQFPQTFMRRMEKMFDYVQHYSRPDGSIPLFGDADDGRLFRFVASQDVNDHRHALCVGSIQFERADLANAADRFSQDALWLFGGEGFEKFQRLKGQTATISSRAFPEGGFYIMRNERVHVMVDAGDIGMRGLGGHGHNDVLSFELWADGEPIIVDSGTYAYTFDLEARQELRRGRAHNTVIVDGKEIADFVGLWMILRDKTHPQVYEWRTSPERDFLEASHEAYHPVIHRRRFELDKKDIVLRITDNLEGTGKHSIESFIHFAPGTRVHLENPARVRVEMKQQRYVIEISTGIIDLFESWYSRSYGLREKNQAMRIALEAEIPTEIHVTIQRQSAV